MMPVKPLRIAYVIDYLYSVNGGTERQLHQLIKGMAERGHCVRLYVYRDTEFTRNLKEFDCPVECLGIHTLGSLTTVAKLWSFRRRLVRDKVDVVHGFFNDVALTLPLFFYRSGLRVFTSRRDMGLWYTPKNLLILRGLSRLRTEILCNCQAVAEWTREKEQVSPQNTHVIFNGIDPYQPDGESTGAPVQTPDVKGGLRVVVVANVRPVKRIEDLIAAAAELKNEPINYSIIGHLSDKKYYQTLVQTIEAAGLTDRFVFLGPVAEPRKHLPHYQVGVICSDSEGLSNTLLEYLDAGLIAVATNVGGNPEIITNGVNGFLYDKGVVSALASILSNIGNTQEKHHAMLVNAKTTFRLFSMENMILDHERIYCSGLIQRVGGGYNDLGSISEEKASGGVRSAVNSRQKDEVVQISDYLYLL
ncbi:glycosyltransferase [Marinobacter sp. X15-166B]|uniref:glycosyltransferase n=1 Tax=Marinobacter sp. X15-166B TaxID=1897620 RepID=UPI00085CBCA6|nr:glycosyltransferase [Marinobacter sp. X15-166B]OEY67754.1 hypothetical protein BG841_15840 [Marinobacter sp. X15-166B]